MIQSVLNRIRRNHNLSVYEADYHMCMAVPAGGGLGGPIDAPSRMESMLGIAEGARGGNW